MSAAMDLTVLSYDELEAVHDTWAMPPLHIGLGCSIAAIPMALLMALTLWVAPVFVALMAGGMILCFTGNRRHRAWMTEMDLRIAAIQAHIDQLNASLRDHGPP